MKRGKIREAEEGDICRRTNQSIVPNTADGSGDRRTGLSCAKVIGDFDRGARLGGTGLTQGAK